MLNCSHHLSPKTLSFAPEALYLFSGSTLILRAVGLLATGEEERPLGFGDKI
jgi:hypothetical protein